MGKPPQGVFGCLFPGPAAEKEGFCQVSSQAQRERELWCPLPSPLTHGLC